MSAALGIEVALRPGALDGAWREALGEAVRAYAGTLAESLGAPPAPRVEVRELDDADELLPGERFRLRVGVEWGRVPLVADDTLPWRDPELDVCRALFEARELLVAADGAPELRRSSGAPAWADDAAVLTAARALARLGVRASRLRWPDGPEGLAAALDATHDEALAVVVEAAEPGVDIATASEKSIRAAAGIPVPRLETRVVPVPLDQVRLRLNDVPLPARRFGASADGTEYALVSHVMGVDLEAHAWMLASGGMADVLLAALRVSAPALAATVRARYPSHVVAGVLRRLVAERAPIDDLRGVMEALLAAAGRAVVDEARYIVFAPPSGGLLSGASSDDGAPLSPEELTEIVRASLGPALRARLADGPSVPVYLCQPGVEADVLRAADDEGARRDLLRRVVEGIGVGDAAGAAPLIIATNSGVRRHLRAILDVELPRVHALAWNEFPVDSELRVAGRIY